MCEQSGWLLSFYCRPSLDTPLLLLRLRWDSEASSYVGCSCRPSPWSQCGEPFSIGNDPTVFSRVQVDTSARRCYLFWAFINFESPGLEDVVFLPEKAETEDLAKLLWSSHVTFFLDFPLNLLSSLSWWWYLNLANHFQHWITNV